MDTDAVLAEMQRELAAEMATSEAAAAESARREGVSRRKLAGADTRLQEANTELAHAARELDARDAKISQTTVECGRWVSSH
jgi:hypothetical protein